MPKRTYTPEERDAALRLYEAEGTSAAAKQTGIPKSTIQSWARAAGVRTVRDENVRARVEAAQLDNAQRRARLISELYDLAEDGVRLLKNPDQYQTIMKGSFGVEEAQRPGFVPAQDKQREATTVAIWIDKAAALEKFDSDNGAAAAKSMLDALASQLGVAGE